MYSAGGLVAVDDKGRVLRLPSKGCFFLHVTAHFISLVANGGCFFVDRMSLSMSTGYSLGLLSPAVINGHQLPRGLAFCTEKLSSYWWGGCFHSLGETPHPPFQSRFLILAAHQSRLEKRKRVRISEVIMGSSLWNLRYLWDRQQQHPKSAVLNGFGASWMTRGCHYGEWGWEKRKE